MRDEAKRPEESALDLRGKTPQEADAAVAERANQIALEAIVAITRASLQDRAFQSMQWTLIFTVLTGYLLWRLRIVR
jgi:hypothetical protein